jgi:hypothetical protein
MTPSADRGDVPHAVLRDESEARALPAHRSTATDSPQPAASGERGNDPETVPAVRAVSREILESPNDRGDTSPGVAEQARARVNADVTNEVHSGARQPDRDTSGRGDDVTINVSIGRIEVARPAPPLLPTATVSSGAPRTSLGDYLRLREKVRGR